MSEISHFNVGLCALTTDEAIYLQNQNIVIPGMDIGELAFVRCLLCQFRNCGEASTDLLTFCTELNRDKVKSYLRKYSYRNVVVEIPGQPHTWLPSDSVDRDSPHILWVADQMLTPESCKSPF